MKTSITSLLFFVSIQAFGQLSEAEILEKRSAHELELTDPAKGVLDSVEIVEFQGLDYFDFDSTFQIQATFTKKKGKRFEMPTSTDRLPVYRRYGIIQFTHNDTLCELEVYQNMALRKNPEFKNYLFIPFRDGTRVIETYGGGRYLDLTIPEGDTVLIDFNLAYNPYCAYSSRYSCPIPPVVNDLRVRITAGEKTPIGH